ncbi:YbaB/EbfC family nucleoid-associated protein [Nocardia sp. NPDC052566]|uniref:YbaB/EbfC family nucleoid-associated protein n=1 Tax=Nocardia sp. NPDC052566 TaxID=3364330 RepID=UPI0037CB5EB6
MDEAQKVREQAAQAMDVLRAELAELARIQRKRTTLIATGEAAERRVMVSLNADGVIIETRFADDIGDLGHEEIAAAVTEAGQRAHAELSRMNEAMMRPLTEQRARLPKMSEVIADLSDFEGMRDIDGLGELDNLLTTPPPVSTAPPGSPERRVGDAEGTSPDSGVKDELW